MKKIQLVKMMTDITSLFTSMFDVLCSMFDVRRIFALLLILFMFIFTMNTHAAGIAAVQGIYIDGTTNTVSVAGVSTNVSLVAASCTNTFNLSNTLLSQANTNFWPAMPFFPFGDSGRNLAIHASYSMVGTNSTNSTVKFRFAGSADGAHWTSNYFIFVMTASDTNVINTLTNCDTYAAPFLALQSIENTNSTTVVTNLQIDAAWKPGL